ncbi:MAG: ABC transporter permease [Balneolaceae bacterium]
MSVRYVLKEGVSGLRRTRLASFTSVFSLFIAVFLIGMLARIGYNAYEVAQTLRQQIEVEIFLEDLDQQTTGEIQSRLEQISLVETLTYISTDSAAAIFREEFGYGSESMANMQFLPASFRLVIDGQADIGEVDETVDEIGSWRGVDEVRFNLALLQMLQSRIELTALAGGGMALLVIIAAIALVFNTIRLTIYSKRDLIRAMKLVGATNGFIRRPFLVEGMLQGAIAGLLASGLLYLLFTYIIPVYIPQMGLLDWPFGRWYYLSGGMMLTALVMGWWGSRWASRTFIKA